MQDRYTGDIGDFGKYALLRALAAEDLRLGVIWYLNRSEEANSDGELINYLFAPTKSNPLSDCDPWLYSQMRDLVCCNRQVSEVAVRKILPGDTIFFDQALPFAKSQRSVPRKLWQHAREQWCQEALRSARDADVVFLDPDNGLANVPITRCSYKSSLKYVFVDELQPYLHRGQSIVLYHHQTRHGTFAEQVENNLNYLEQWTDTERPWAVTYHRGQARAYFILASASHRHTLTNRCIRLLQSAWGTKGHFKGFRIRDEKIDPLNGGWRTL